MIDDEEETEAGKNADSAEMSGEPDVSRLRLVGPGPTSVAETYETPSGAVVEVISSPEIRERRVVEAATHPLVASSATPTDRVLYRVRARRDEHDQRDGYFRDYKDGTGRPSDAHAVLAAAAAHEEAVKAVRVTWRHKLDVALSIALAETSEKKLPEKLTEVAAIVTAWQEAIELRGSKARILAEQGAVKHVQRANGSWKKVHLMPWWRRVLKALHIVQ